MSNQEKIYDEEIAPLLLKAGEICQKHGMTIVAQVEYEPGEFGLTAAMGENPSLAMQMLRWLAMAKTDIGRFLRQVQNHARKHGHSSASLYLLGVEPIPRRESERR